MNKFLKNSWSLIFALLMVGGFMTACDDDDEVNGGIPEIHYVRVTDPAAADSLLVGAPLGNLIAVIGVNLDKTQELWFNDRKAELDPAYITSETILVSIPRSAPVEVTNQMRLVFRDGNELLHDFEVTISDPELTAMDNEYTHEGDVALINGDYFFEPLTVTFTGGVEAEIVAVEQTSLEFVVPEGAEPGPITVSTNFGTTESSFHYWDQRNLLLNYDDLTAEGSWRSGVLGSEDGIDGNYLVLGGEGETYNANERIEDPFASQFWGHTRYNVEQNLFDGYPEDFVLKFEARVVDWYGSYLQITWGPWDNAGNDEYWGNLNGRGLWRPWEEDNSNFSTDGEWITVSIPLTEMIYSHNQNEDGDNIWEPNMEFDPDVAGTLSFWVIATPVADNSPVEIHMDNVRIVER